MIIYTNVYLYIIDEAKQVKYSFIKSMTLYHYRYIRCLIVYINQTQSFIAYLLNYTLYI